MLLPADHLISHFSETPVYVILKDPIRLVGIQCTADRTGRGTPGGAGTGGPAHIAAQNR